jgi:hypothetical protein
MFRSEIVPVDHLSEKRRAHAGKTSGSGQAGRDRDRYRRRHDRGRGESRAAHPCGRAGDGVHSARTSDDSDSLIRPAEGAMTARISWPRD